MYEGEGVREWVSGVGKWEGRGGGRVCGGGGSEERVCVCVCVCAYEYVCMCVCVCGTGWGEEGMGRECCMCVHTCAR